MSEETQELEVINADTIGAIERAQIDVQIATARKYGRILSNVKAKMLSFATLDEETAQSCFYTLPARKGGEGKPIKGPSVRLAEIALACYGHIKAGSRIIADDGKFITAQACVHDLENNVAIAIEVKRRVTTRDGKRYSDDMIATTGNAACSIALRNAAFRVVPRALVMPVYEEAVKVAVGNIKSLTTKRAKVIERLKAAGATEARILAAVDASKIEDIDLEKMETLIGLGTAMKDGSISLEEAFPDPSAKEEPISKPRFKPKTTQPAEPTPQPEPQTETDTRPESGPVQNLDPVEKANPDSYTRPGLTPAQERLSEIILSEGCTFDTLLFICGDPKEGVTVWNHLTKDCASISDMLAEHVNQLLGKEKQLRTFLRTAKEAGK